METSNKYNLDLGAINESNGGVADRSDVFYWQTDRVIKPDEAGAIWADRHRYFDDVGLVNKVNDFLNEDKLVFVEPLDIDAQTSLGNVNSVRSGVLESGQEVIIRAHPKGIRNGYFHVEAAAAKLAKESGLPSFDTIAVHDLRGFGDFAFQVIEKLPGTAVSKWLETNPGDETVLLSEIGKTMAKMHQIKVDGFGPFDNERAKIDGQLVGIHESSAEAIQAGLFFNLDVLEKAGIITANQKMNIADIFDKKNPLLKTRQAVLVHNDFADWNLLTDGKKVTGILDWDECVGGDPVADLACWSTFYEPDRVKPLLDGYWQVAKKPIEFDDRFELLRLRYILSKMTLRMRRQEWEPSEFIAEKIAVGKKHLAQSFEYFGI